MRVAFFLSMLVVHYFSGIDMALAEGRCPPGQYPVGGQGVLGCAPIPGYGSDSAAQNDDAGPLRPRGKWKVTWGAIAWSAESGIAGVALNQYFSKRKAEAAALKRCAFLEGEDCVIAFSFYDQCAAAARNGGAVSVSGALRVEQAQSAAMANCALGAKEEGVANACAVTWSGCAERVYVPRL